MDGKEKLSKRNGKIESKGSIFPELIRILFSSESREEFEQRSEVFKANFRNMYNMNYDIRRLGKLVDKRFGKKNGEK